MPYLLVPHQTPKDPNTYVEVSLLYVLNGYFDNYENVE